MSWYYLNQDASLGEEVATSDFAAVATCYQVLLTSALLCGWYGTVVNTDPGSMVIACLLY